MNDFETITNYQTPKKSCKKCNKKKTKKVLKKK